MSLKYGVLIITFIYFIFLLSHIHSLKYDKLIYSAEISCNSTKKFDCQFNNTCVDTKYLCNGIKDCPNSKDEDDALCSNVTCSSDQFKCDKYKCLPTKDWLCDGEFDCVDKSDEGEYCRLLNCSADYFKCKKNGKCIPKTFACDGEKDCGFGDDSDEQNCTFPPCKEIFEFRCDNQNCIAIELLCDDELDCADGSDEKNCSKVCTEGANGTNCFSINDYAKSKETSNHVNKSVHLCHKDEFQCGSNECIKSSYRCDGEHDCLDNSDEKNCTEIKKSIEDLDCITPSKQCIDINTKKSICLPIENFCNNHRDCIDNSDEGGLCDKDLCFNTNCTGTCHNTPTGALCYFAAHHCPNGLVAANDGCVEKKSVCDFGTCSGTCVPLKNRHKCECEKGYMLESDGFTCKTLDTTPAYIIFSNRHEIRSIDLHTMTSSRPLVSGLKNTIALDFYHSKDNDLIFFTDIVDDKIYKGSIIHGSLINIQVIVETGLSTAEGLAVDYIGENLYWIESMLDQIEVAKFDGSSRKTLIAGSMESPRSVVLDPRDRIMFWSDWDQIQPRIETASMSGEDRRVIYNMTNKEGAWPNGLTLCYMNRRIYWVDARSDSIRTITYDGEDHREILKHHDLITHPFAITLFGNYLYYTDWKTNSVVRANKFNGSDVRVVQKAMTQPFDIKSFHPSRQPKSDTVHPCSNNNGNCSHLCLLSKRYVWKCECPHIMKLDKDNRTCVPNEKILFFARPNEIRGVDVENMHYHIVPPISIPKVINTQQIDFLAKEKRIYWADTESNELKRSNLNSSVVDVIIDTVIESPSGFAIDWISSNIFITSQETSKPKIYVCNSNGEYIHTVISQNLSKPFSLAVDPFNGTLFWSDYGSENLEPIISPYIGYANMDSTDVGVLVTSKNEPLLSKPSSLVLKFDQTKLSKLYWANVGSGSIQSYDFNTHKVETIWNDNNNANKLVLSPYALCLKGESLLFSSQTYPSLYQYTAGEKLKELPLLRNQSEAITALKIYDKALQYGTNLCALNNGNCSHLCLPVSTSKRKCKCAIGFESDPNDETKCIGENEFLLMAINLGLRGVSLNQTIHNGTILGDKSVLPPISKVLMATNIDFDYKDSHIYWVDSDDGSITRIKQDTTGYQTIVKNVDNLEDIAVDWIADNIYFIESTYNVIEVARLSGTNRYVIVSSNLSKPTSLTLDPIEGYLFWSDANENSVQIFRSRLDGTEQQLILNDTNKIYINKLAIDLNAKQIYWCDSKSQAIERVNYDGKNRTLVYKNSFFLKYPISLTVHKQWIYWADTNFDGGSILKVDTINVTDQQRNASIVTEKMGDHIKDLRVYAEQPANKKNPCAHNNGGCLELCLYLGDNRHRCVCSHGRLSANNRTCEPFEAFIMFSRIVDIDSIHVSDDNIQNSPYPLISNKTYMQNVIGLTFSYKDKKIIYSDIQKGSINSMNFNGTEHRILVDKQGAVEGIAFDPLMDEIYWTSNSDASINRFRIGNHTNRTVEKIIKLGSNDKPRGIALDSCRSMIYWTNWNLAHPSIQRSYLNGNVIQSIITADIRMPNAICLDHQLQKLYWSDARLDKIERCNYDGSGCVVIIHETPQHAFDLALYGDFLYWSDWVCAFGDRYGKGCIYRVNKFTGGDLKLLKRRVPRPMAIIAVANDTEDCSLNPCLKMNGGCQDRCNVENNGTVVCSCFMGRQLADDRKTCEIVKISIENATCASNEFRCQNGKCIIRSHVCDLENDCGDRSDEAPFQNCKLAECKSNEFRCSNGECILSSYYCDSDDDCGDLSDEPFGCVAKDCRKDQFKCRSSNRCLPKSALCNKIPECDDNSDEDPVMCNSNTTEHCPKDKYECTNKICINISLICNDHDDCGDNSDEARCNINECDQKNPDQRKCAQVCEDLPIGYRCNCHTGFEPIDDGKLCNDINECNQTQRVCSQVCKNTYGSFKCSCVDGYKSVENGTSCVADSAIKPMLLFSNRFVIRQANLLGGELTQKVSHLSNAVALDFDYADKCIYWSNITPLGSLIKRVCEGKNDTHGNQLKETIHSNAVQSPDGLAVDWISKNLYFCDKMKDTIEVSKLNGLYRKVLINENLQEPRAIVLSPHEGIMFYSDWGENPYIARAGMDGSDSKIIVNDGLGWPNGLALDTTTRELFYGDAKLDFIAVCDYDGKRRSVIISKRNSRMISHVFALSVFEDYIYFTDWESKSISKCHKYKCENSTKLIDVFHRPMDIQVYHPLRQRPLDEANPCDKLNCQTLCLLKPNNETNKLSATCACPENFILNVDNRTCTNNCTSPSVCKTTFNCSDATNCPEKQSESIDCALDDDSDSPGRACGNYSTCAQDHIYCKHGYCSQGKWVCENFFSCNDKEFCYNRGTCLMVKIQDNNRTYSRPKCECNDKRYRGERCEQCEKEGWECKNGGYCTYPTNFTTPECRCKTGYLGNNCEKSLCDNYCSNGGLCRLASGIPKCLCQSGFIGRTCAQDTCKGFCMNGGVCVQDGDKRKCSCPTGYSGKRCEVNKCNCLNGGYCNSSTGKCICAYNFTGKHCENFIATTCKKVECNNGGICKINEQDHRAYCECPKRYKGIFCDILATSTLDCKDFFCLNGGTCAIANDSLICVCPGGRFAGDRCENILSAPINTNVKQSTGSRKRFYILLTFSILFFGTLAFAFGFIFKVHRRNRHFAHRRMNETHGNLEIRNPIFDGDIGEDSITTGLNPAYSLDKEDEKNCNFENPVYNFNSNSYNSSPREDESRNLLIDDQNFSRNSNENTKFHPLA